MMTHEWRVHPKLRGRLHPEHPDDVQVIVHDGGPRTTTHKPELIWVSITGSAGDVFRGKVLNAPQQLSSVAQDGEIQFIVPDSGEFPILVTGKYLGERSNWIVHACQQCGMSELFDAPSDLMRVVFPNAPPDAIMEMFTAYCGVCGGVQIIQHRSAVNVDELAKPAEKRWWEFWR